MIIKRCTNTYMHKSIFKENFLPGSDFAIALSGLHKNFKQRYKRQCIRHGDLHKLIGKDEIRFPERTTAGISTLSPLQIEFRKLLIKRPPPDACFEWQNILRNFAHQLFREGLLDRGASPNDLASKLCEILFVGTIDDQHEIQKGCHKDFYDWMLCLWHLALLSLNGEKYYFESVALHSLHEFFMSILHPRQHVYSEENLLSARICESSEKLCSILPLLDKSADFSYQRRYLIRRFLLQNSNLDFLVNLSPKITSLIFPNAVLFSLTPKILCESISAKYNNCPGEFDSVRVSNSHGEDVLFNSTFAWQALNDIRNSRYRGSNRYNRNKMKDALSRWKTVRPENVFSGQTLSWLEKTTSATHRLLFGKNNTNDTNDPTTLLNLDSVQDDKNEKNLRPLELLPKPKVIIEKLDASDSLDDNNALWNLQLGIPQHENIRSYFTKNTNPLDDKSYIIVSPCDLYAIKTSPFVLLQLWDALLHYET